jgi:hypothetical protein
MGETMAASVESLMSCAAAFMLALTPITGPCEARTFLYCSGDNITHRILLWDEKNPLQPQPHSPGKACHACMFDNRKGKPDRDDEPDDA